MNFFSTTVSAYTENDVHIVGFGDHVISPDRYVIVSRYDDPGYPEQPPEERIGIDTSASITEIAGAIASMRLSHGALDIVLHHNKVAQPEIHHLTIRFELDAAAFTRLHTQLRLICADTGILLMQPGANRD